MLFTSLVFVWRKYYVMACYCTFLPNFTFSDVMSVAGNQPVREFTPWGSAKATNRGFFFFFPETLVVKYVPVHHWIDEEMDGRMGKKVTAGRALCYPLVRERG